jgi:CRISPR/Cas system-associated exonuclease Cas4 (RecB family)
VTELTDSFTGARWSSAVRCVARATYQGLGIAGDEAAHAPLQRFFDRGASAADAWAITQQAKHEAAGKPFERERPIAWGLDWEGHADAAKEDEKLIIEAYHSTTAEVVHAKALQAAGYADMSGPEWTAMLAVVDATDCDIDLGFAVHLYPVDVDELRPEVRDIQTRVITAVQEGAVRDSDKIGDDPNHEECRTCPFREHCWADWVRPPIERLEGHDALGQEILNEQLEISRLKRELEAAEERRKLLRSTLDPYMTPGVEQIVGPVIVKKTMTAPRRSFKIAAYMDAGHPITPSMYEFYDAKPSTRWTVVGL